MRKFFYAFLATGALIPSSTMAATLLNSTSTSGPKSTSGSSNGMSWTARSLIVGQTSTSTIPSGGNPAYLAFNKPGYSGVAGLLMRYDSGAGFVCSGSLLKSGRIVTAAHCVSGGFANDINGRAAGLVSTTAFFYDDGEAPLGFDPFIYDATQPGITAIDISNYSVNPGYTGEVIDQNDIAVLSLSQAAPSWAQRYDLYTPGAGGLTGEQFNVTGYGTRSLIGGAEGTTGPGAGAGVGRLRQGENVYDYRFGDEAFGGVWNAVLGGTAQYDYSYISDFDNGLAAQSMSCRVSQALIGGATPGGFCTNGVGPLEVSIAGGDSGGPAFIDGKIASVNSYGLTFGPNFGDIKPGLQSSWGELNGFVPTYIHSSFIAGVPEPSTWAMLLLGFGFIGGSMRRRTAIASRVRLTYA